MRRTCRKMKSQASYPKSTFYQLANQRLRSPLESVASEPQDALVLLKHMTFCILLAYTIYTLIIHRNCKEPIGRKTLRKVFITHPPYQRELVILKEKSLQSFPLPSPTIIPIKWRFVHKHYLHPFKVLRVFFELGKHWKIPRMAYAMGLLRDPESQRRHGQA